MCTFSCIFSGVWNNEKDELCAKWRLMFCFFCFHSNRGTEMKPCFCDSVCWVSLAIEQCKRVNFSTYIHINIYIRQVAGYCAMSIHITPLALMKQFCVLIPCDSECMTCSIWWKAQAKFNLQQSVMEICKMARFSVNERTIDNAIQLAAKAAIWIAVKGVIARVAPRQLPFTKGPWLHKKSHGTTRKA